MWNSIYSDGMLNEISAEMLLEQLYPELTEEWSVRCKGVFYRNYSDDAMRVDPEERQVELARDGFLQLLPSSLLTEDAETDRANSGGKAADPVFQESLRADATAASPVVGGIHAV